MISRALFFGVAIFFTLGPASALATTTPSYQRPVCTLSASRSAVELGKTVNLSWQSQYATQGFITSIGTVGTAGTQGVIPTGSGTTYVGTFTGPGGTGNCSITVSIIQPNGGGGTVDGSGTVTSPGSTGVQNSGLVNPTSGIGGPSNTVDDPGSSGVLYPGTVNAPGGANGPGTVAEPDKLPQSQSGDSPTTLPPADNITLSNTQSTGLIPCKGLDCQACDLATLAQKIINFLLGLSIPLAAVMFAYAGVIYFTSSVETSINKIEKAHAIFRQVGIGFMIVLGAWLGVNTVLKTILNPDMFKEGSWFTIQCVNPASRPTDKKISDLLSILPGLNTNTLAPVGSSQGTTPICSYGSTYNATVEGCVNADGEVSQPTGYGASFDQRFPSQVGKGDCSPGALENVWGSSAGGASCIAQRESSCNPNLCGDNGASCGLYQINWTANNVVCDGEVLPCKSAVYAPYTGSNKTISIRPGMESLAAECVQTLKKTNCNTQTALNLYQSSGFKPWSTARGCGLI